MASKRPIREAVEYTKLANVHTRIWREGTGAATAYSVEVWLDTSTDDVKAARALARRIQSALSAAWQPQQPHHGDAAQLTTVDD